MAKRQIWPEADQYRIREVPDIFIPHPEGLPSTLRNCLVVGSAGVGKTMVLKKLCYDLSQSSGKLLPIYIKIEPWIGKLSGEIAYPIEIRRTPREKELDICIRILIALGLTKRIYKYAEVSIVKAAADQFPKQVEYDDNIEKWIETQLLQIRKVVEQGEKLPNDYLSFPPLSEFANVVGERAKEDGITLVFLLDQVDKTPKPIFESITSLLRRGDYISVIATRPCPSAPDSVIMPSQVIPGNDYTVHWLGSDPRSVEWKKFISDVTETIGFDRQTLNLMFKNIKNRFFVVSCGI